MKDSVELVAELESRRYRAMVEADVATLDELLAEELVYTHSNGSRDTKQTYLDKVGSGSLRYMSVEHPVETVIARSGLVIVIGLMNATLLLQDGGTRQLRNSSTAVWHEEPAGWRLLAYQPTPVL